MGPPQPKGGLLARALWMALLHQALPPFHRRIPSGDGQPRPRSLLPRPILRGLGSRLVPPPAHGHRALLGRGPQRPLRGGRAALGICAARDLLRQLRRTWRARGGRRARLRRQRQGHRPAREPPHHGTGVGGGLARLPPPLPLGLRRSRAWCMGPVEPHQGLHRCVQRRRPRLGAAPLLSQAAGGPAGALGGPRRSAEVRGRRPALPAAPGPAGARRPR
mmetsp:Transcript_55384/g.164660  ORF Transcript_55384/g.164660 Transcript_55384/m.164660 type:complete len:219 (+) Transcript_55384:575-1231(+)